MSTSEVPSLVSCAWLKEKRDQEKIDQKLDQPNVTAPVVLDVSWASTKDCKAEFNERHIPGARHLDVMTGAHTALHPRALPDADTLQADLRAAGVNDDSHVVLYSHSDNAGFFMSSRAWWTLKMFGAKRMSILNGGLQRWLDLGYQTDSGTPVVQPGDFTAKYEPSLRRTIDDAVEVVKSGQSLLDSRASAKFNEGHLPGAKSLPYTSLIDQGTMEMRSPDDVKQVFKEAGMDLSKPVTTYCNSGMSSCTLAFALSLCGASDFAVFQGGFTEWKSRTEDKIEKS